MASTWADQLPRVHPPMASRPKRVTIVIPYYENPAFLLEQAATWRTYAAALAPSISVIVVDDGSPHPAVLPLGVPFDVRLFRIAVDVRWNWIAARNIGAHHAADAWLLLTDIDHVIPAETIQSVVLREHDPRVVYAFSRREHTGAPVNPHSASFLMTRRLFWAVGGYDETLSGYYGTDGDFRRRVARLAKIHVLPDELVRYEYVADASTTRYLRKQPEDREVARLVNKRGPGWRPKVLSFPYAEVQC